MTLADRALAGLSVAFTASIIAYADLPANIPPHVPIDGGRVFIGKPFVALLLPLAAIAVWVLLARLRTNSPDAIPSSADPGPATALLLSAFHVTMLIAIIGVHLWLAR